MNEAITYLLLYSRGRSSGISVAEAERRFIGHKASFLMEGKGLFSHTYLSPAISDSKRSSILRECVANGDDTIYSYLTNEGDYRGKSINPCPVSFDSPEWGKSLDEALMFQWGKEFEKMISMGLYPIFWLYADDSPTISGKSPMVLGRLTKLLVERFDKYAVGWVGALEANEHMSGSQMDMIYGALNTGTNKPKGVHLTPMAHTKSDFWRLADYYFLQTNEPNKHIDNPTIAKHVKQAIAHTRKKVVAAEYHIHSHTEQARQLGRTAMDAGAMATGNGR